MFFLTILPTLIITADLSHTKRNELSTKQYYSRLSGLLEAGLIKRRKSTYSLTLLGKVVYDSQMIIGEALSHYWKLKAIETIEVSSSNLPVE